MISKRTKTSPAPKCKFLFLQHLYTCISHQHAVGSKVWEDEWQAEMIICSPLKSISEPYILKCTVCECDLSGPVAQISWIESCIVIIQVLPHIIILKSLPWEHGKQQSKSHGKLMLFVWSGAPCSLCKSLTFCQAGTSHILRDGCADCAASVLCSALHGRSKQGAVCGGQGASVKASFLSFFINKWMNAAP